MRPCNVRLPTAMTSHTIKDAEEAIRRKLAQEKFNAGEIKYDVSEVVENDRWWYVPFSWIGCFGFIVNKSDLYVNWLGSALHPNLEECLWGHDHGLYCEFVDFSFAPDTDTQLALRLLPKFKHTHAPDGAAPLSDPAWYSESEIQLAFERQFPTFRRHFVWYAIPALRIAYEKEGLRFSCVVSKEA